MNQTSILHMPQASLSGYASRMRLDQTSLMVSTQPVARTNKRTNAAINYADFEEDFDEEFEENGSEPSMVPKYETDKIEKPQEQKRVVYQKTAHGTYSQQKLMELGEQDQLLIPIKIVQEVDTFRLSDFFMWDVNDPVLTPEEFAKVTCADLNIPVGFFHPIAMMIRQQIEEYRETAMIKLPVNSSVNVIINMSVNLNKQLYEDRFEWDVAGSDITPEEFAKSVVQDLGISGEFYPAIAHALHDQILRMKREIVEGHLADFDNLASNRAAAAGWRVDPDGLGEDWCPTVEVLSAEEIEKREIERERLIRRAKRESARQGDDYGRKKQRIRFRRDDSPSNSPW